MVYTLDSPHEGSVWGRLGKGVGQGIADQLPKEIERGRLSSAIEGLENNKGQSELQQAASLIRGGASPEMLNYLQPFLRNSAIRNSVGNPQAQGQGFDPNGQPMPSQGRGGNPQSKGRSIPGQNQEAPEIVNPDFEANARDPIIKASIPQIKERAFQLMNQQPALYSGDDGFARARVDAEAELNRPAEIQEANIAAGERQKGELSALRNGLLEKTRLKLQKQPIGGNETIDQIIPGQTYNKFRDEAENNYAKGMSKEKATDLASDKMLDLAKDINVLRNDIGGRDFFGKPTAKLAKDVKDLKKHFTEYGEKEIFKNELKNNLDVGDHWASAQTWEPSKQMQKELINVKSKDSSDKIAANFIGKIDGEDSIFTLGYMLNKLGADDEAVINRLQELSQNGLWEPNDRQRKELSAYYGLTPTLGDGLAYEWFGTVLNPIDDVLRIRLGKQKIGYLDRIKQRFGKE